MLPPRWFWNLLAACVVIATAVFTYSVIDQHRRGRFTFHTASGTTEIMDTRTGVVCYVRGAGQPLCADAPNP